MIDGLRPYAETKPTGLPWLGDVPAHWDVRRNGRLFGARRETGFPDLPILEVSIRSGVRIRDFDRGARKQEMADRSKYQRAMRGDIAYNMMRMWQGAVGIAPVDGLVSPAYVVARPFPETDAAYYAYLFRTGAYMREIDVFSRGIVPDRNRLYWESFKQIPSVYPPVDEQRLIVRFLDWHGAQTAKLVRAKKKIIALLNEQKQAIIHRAVTRGLDPNAKLKPSGIPWLGDVPEGWEVKRLKQVSRIRYGLGQPPAEKVGGLPLIRATNVDHGRILAKNLVYVDPDAVPKSRGAFLKTGEIIVVRSGAYTADSAIIPAEYEGSVAGYDIIVTATHVLPEFLAAVLLAPHVQIDQLIPASMRAAQPHLNAEELGAAVLAVPDAQTQRSIVTHIDNEAALASKAIDIGQREIALIQEFRTRLIADVVTGKLDVRAAAASLPDVTDIEPVDDLAEVDDLEEAIDATENEEVAA
jgi:type I restriction enzyme S subunit